MEPKTPHILREFDEAINSLNTVVTLMASQARSNLSQAVSGLLDRDLNLCRAVIADDHDVDEADRQVDATGIDILLRFHPVAF